LDRSTKSATGDSKIDPGFSGFSQTDKIPATCILWAQSHPATVDDAHDQKPSLKNRFILDCTFVDFTVSLLILPFYIVEFNSKINSETVNLTI
jgi:hypothetical protein